MPPFTCESAIHEFTYNPRTVRGATSFQPWQIFELSGILAQIQDIWHTYGAEETQLFIDYLLAIEKNPCALMMQLASDMWERAGQPFDSTLTSAAVTWSLLGSYEQDKWGACPTERFVRLWELLSKEGVGNKADSLPKLFDLWSKQLGVSTVEDGLADTRKTFHRLRESIEKRLVTLPGSFVSDYYGKLILRVVDSVARASDHMIEQFYESPLTYVAAHLYINNANLFVNPLLRVVIESGGLQLTVSRKELEEKGYIIQWATQDESKDLIFSLIEPYAVSKYSFLNADDVDSLSGLIGLTDFLFAETARGRDDVQRPGRAFFQNSSDLTVNCWFLPKLLTIEGAPNKRWQLPASRVQYH